MEKNGKNGHTQQQKQNQHTKKKEQHTKTEDKGDRDAKKKIKTRKKWFRKIKKLKPVAGKIQKLLPANTSTFRTHLLTQFVDSFDPPEELPKRNAVKEQQYYTTQQ